MGRKKGISAHIEGERKQETTERERERETENAGLQD